MSAISTASCTLTLLACRFSVAVYSSTLSLTSVLDGVSGQRHAPAALSPGKTRYPLYRRLGGPQGRSGVCGKSRPHCIPGPSSPQYVPKPTELSGPLRKLIEYKTVLCCSQSLLPVTNTQRLLHDALRCNVHTFCRVAQQNSGR